MTDTQHIRLLPRGWKIAGIVLTVAAIVFTVLYSFFEFNFSIPVFAVYSQFLETKTLTTFSTHFADELIMMLFVAGLALIIFSEEKNETNGLDLVRAKAFARALAVNTVLLLFSILFVYGAGFIAALVFNMISMQLLYLLFFYAAKRRKAA